MKKNVLTILFLTTVVTLTSCYDFQREQQIKDAEAHGKAVLVEAESSKKALIETAKAENESATLRAEAAIKIAKAEAASDIERAKGVAEANKIIGESLKNNPEYLRYLQIEGIKKSEGKVIYIPTEAGLPIIEARNN